MANNGKKGNTTLAKELQELIDDNYHQNYVKQYEASEDDFYHAIHEIIEKLNEKKGGIQLKLPTRQVLEKYKDHFKNRRKLTEAEFNRIVTEIITLDSFKVGKGALDTIAFLFGAPISAFFAKRFIPGGASVSDDILIPAVTSLTVFLLAKTNKL